MTAEADWREHAARWFEPKPRRWARPGDLARALDPATLTSPALDLIDRELVRLADHQVPADGLVVMMPPQEGKSARCSRRFPEWLLTHDPALRIAIVSYEGEMAVRWGRQIKRDISHADPRMLNVRVMADSSAAGRWDTPEGGGIYCTGIGGALSGRPVDCISGDTHIECEYGQLTAARAYARGIRWIRAYDPASGRPVWRQVEAARRIAGRRVVEITTAGGRHLTCTPDHRVYTRRGYVPAGNLRPGDALVALVAADRVPVREPAGDRQGAGPQGDQPRTGTLLLAGVHGSGVQPGQSDPVLRLRGPRAAAPRLDLLRQLPGPAGTHDVRTHTPNLRPCAPAATADQAMPAMWRAVYPPARPAEVLRPGLREHGTLSPDDRPRQLALQGSGQLRALVPVDAPPDPGPGRPGLCGLPGVARDHLPPVRQDRPPVSTGRASRQPRPHGQPPGEPDHAVRYLPHGAPQVEDDSVAVVRQRRGGPVEVYDFQVAGARNFFGGGLLVHNCLIIDDPVKDREAAESSTLRERAWEWWESVAVPRLAPGGIVVLILTRWHEDDLAGRILSRPSPLRWRVLSMPAIALPNDPLGRAAGVEFPSVRGRERGHFHRLQANTSAYVFSGIYQQTPTAAEGNLFRRAAYRYWRAVAGVPDPGTVLASGVIAGAWLELEGRRVDLADPAVWRFATVDVAASTKTSADWTVVSVWAIDREGDLILLDRARGHAEMADHFAMAKPLRDRWRFDVLYVEHQFYSKTLVIDARAAGMPVAEVMADTDKVTRAIPAAGRVHAGKVWFPAAAPWIGEWTDELASFPRGAHDDQVDTLSYAARIAAAHWTPAPPPARPDQLPADLARIQAAIDAATGNGHVPPPDLMSMPLG